MQLELVETGNAAEALPVQDVAQTEPLVITANNSSEELEARYADRLLVRPELSRQLVSFQASKTEPFYRWFKFKEAFSPALVSELLCGQNVRAGRILDPFAGSGTALFAASDLGLHADGIELLPIGQEIIKTRQQLRAKPDALAVLERWQYTQPWKSATCRAQLHALRITQGAYPPETLDGIERFLGALLGESEAAQAVLRFALLCVLESVSYTRKDGQYLRWDARSGRKVGATPFNKGAILPFDTAIAAKFEQMRHDLAPTFDDTANGLFPKAEIAKGTIRCFSGSCLETLPLLPPDSYDAIVTSPPYCNRYDYTRTYALELALLGASEAEIVQLRQELLSCTVENKPKHLLKINPNWARALQVVAEQSALQAVLRHLDDQHARKLLNNLGIARMVRGYFDEMACAIQECARVLKPGAPLFMVNDNVRYAGVSIPVDLILSDFAAQLGFDVSAVWVLPIGKGNSSQQMGEHGREPLRKCVYLWRKR